MSRCTNSPSCHHDPACEDVDCQGRPDGVDHFEVGEHDVPPGVTVCFVKDSRTGQIVRDGLDIDRAEAIAAGMNESACADAARDEGEDLGCC